MNEEVRKVECQLWEHPLLVARREFGMDAELSVFEVGKDERPVIGIVVTKGGEYKVRRRTI